MSGGSSDNDTLPSAAEIAARRAAELAAEPPADESSTKSAQPDAAETPAEPPAEEDPYAAFRDLPAPTEPELLELRRAAANAEKYLDALKRSKADFVNYQNRMGREREQIREFARRGVLTELLDVVDKFLLSMDRSGEHDEGGSFFEAMKLVESELRAFMQRVGLARIEAKGTAFDPELHEALMQAPSDQIAEGDVMDEIRAGYRLGDHVLRPTQVVVSRGPAAPAPEGEDPTDPGAE